ncbi:hypothetical protein EXW62_09100 [Bacillus mycoides]|nr:hypothetical protein EXW62_09100 [Bacillus mycoides]
MTIQYGTLDAGYDYEAIYTQLYRMKAKAIIAYNKRNEGEFLEFDEHFAPTFGNIRINMTALMTNIQP